MNLIMTTLILKFKSSQPYLLFLALFSLSLPLAASAANGPEYGEFVKTYEDNFDIASDGTVELYNRHGKINVTHHDLNEVDVKVRVIVQARDQATADRTISRIGIEMSSSSAGVEVRTEIRTGRNNDNWGNDFKIIYDIRLPRTVKLEVDAKHCDLYVDDHEGNVELLVKYGDLHAESFGATSYITVAYGNAEIDQLSGNSRVNISYGEIDLDAAESLELKIRYSEGQIGELENLLLDSRYDEMEIDRVTNLSIDAGYTDFEIGTVDNVRARSNYSEYEFEEIRKNADIETGYGDISIDRLAAGFNAIAIRGNYSDVEMAPQSGSGYSFSGRAAHGDVSVPANLDINRRDREGHSESIEGQIAGTGQGTIRISTTYGDIDIR